MNLWTLKPGEQWRYNNSGYFLLGYIVEKVTDQPYGKYIEENYLVPLNMNNSSYGSVAKIIKNKVTGYQKSEENYINAEYWSISQAYAAGGLFSTVDDLAKWYSAVSSNQVVSEASFNKAITPAVLNNGDITDYAYGWHVGNIQGSPMITHGGNMDGYATWSNYLLDEKIFVAVFSNCMCQPPYLATYKIAAIAVDKPYEWQEIKLDEDLLLSYDGVYASDKHGEKVISYTNGQFKFYDPAWHKHTMYPFAKDKFFFDDGPLMFSTLNIIRDENSKINSIQLLGEGFTKTWQKTDKPFKKYPSIDVDPKTFSDYIGKYELFPDFFLQIIEEKNQLYTVQAGREKNKLTVFAEHQFDSEALDAQFTFNFDENNKVTSFTLHQGKDYEAKKVN